MRVQVCNLNLKVRIKIKTCFSISFMYTKIMATTLPIEILYLLEEKIGKEEARKVSSAITASLDTIENKANDTALQKKLELKDELTKELATKADIAELKGEINLIKSELYNKASKSDILNLEWKTKLYFVILLCAIFITNTKALEVIAKLFGIVK